MSRVSVVIPCYNEAKVIGACIEALLAQTLVGSDGYTLEIVAVPNGCSDDTEALLHAMVPGAAERGVALRVLPSAVPSKSNALNVGDQAAEGAIRVYLDADVVCAADTLLELAQALDSPEPLYGTGTIRVAPGTHPICRSYARIWTRIPAVCKEINGIGLYAVNAAGRRRWGRFPNIFSDDKFVKLQFDHAERVRVAGRYTWPIAEDPGTLIKLRMKWSAASKELERTYPELLHRSHKMRGHLLDYLRVFSWNPVSGVVFVSLFTIAGFRNLMQSASAPQVWERVSR
jgi:glycosyltransferase involved in cell wall biosynthesis